MLYESLRRLRRVAPATALAFAALAAAPLVALGEAATLPVTKTADTADGSCDSDCSLREAIIAANADADRDVVTVPAGRYELTIRNTPGAQGDTAADGDLDLRAAVAIRGAGAPSTSVVGVEDSEEVCSEEECWEEPVADGQVFEASTPGKTSFAASISGLTVTGGIDGGIINGRRVALHLTEVAIRENFVDYGRSGYGGSGGGIANSGRVEINRSTISDNSSGPRASGGGIDNSGTLLLRNSTVSGNSASFGGGIRSSGTLTARSSTIAFNDAYEEGGGIAADGATRFKNTIVARNTAYGDPSNCYGAVRSLGHNLERGRSCGFNHPSDVRGWPRLGWLADNGGPTLTHRLLSGSPAIDAGAPSSPPTDQRGVARPQGPKSDIGAFERMRR